MVPGRSSGKVCNCNKTNCDCGGPRPIGHITLATDQMSSPEIMEHLDRLARSVRVKDWEQRIPRKRRR